MKISNRIVSLVVVLILCLLSVNTLLAQKTKTKSVSVTNKEKDSRAKTTRSRSGTIKRRGSNTYWIIGISGNVVDDDGNPFKKLFNAPLRWNFRPYPTRITIEKYIGHSFGMEGVFSFNTYLPGKIINNDQTHGLGIFLAADMNFKNDFNKILNADGWFNPYMVYGVGTTFRTLRSFPVGVNLNIGFGANLWLTRSVGLNLQSIAKFGVSTRFPRASSNYLQHSLGIVIKIQKGGKRSFAKRRYKWIHRNNIGRERN